jgi:predicted dehydrogenase
MRRDAAKAADYAARHGVDRWYSDAEALMNDPDINAVYIATPPAFHKEYAIKALRRGLSVYLEKPVTLNAVEAEVIAKVVLESDGKLVAAHYRRALPMFLFVKDLLARKAIGEVRTVQIRTWQPTRPELVRHTEQPWRLDPTLSGGGYFHDLAPHQLDLMLYFFGPPIRMRGLALNQANLSPADDYITGTALFDNNIVLNGSWCFNVAAQDQADECLIAGSEGSIRFPFFGRSVCWRTPEFPDGQVLDFAPPMHIQQPMIEQVVNYFQHKGDNPCSIEEATIVMRVMDAFAHKV